MENAMAVKRWVSALVVGVGLLAAAPAAMAQDVLVLAAASTKNAVDLLAAQFKAKSGVGVTSSFAASSALAKQIENGAPADLFLSADLDWMDYLHKRNLIKTDSRINLLGNALVVIAPKGSTLKPELTPGGNLPALIGDGRLATGDPSNVPVGKYAQAALQSLGQWAQVEPKLARADNVRAALALVSRGEAPLGIVYSTDAAVDPGVTVVGVFPADSHPAIVYPAALTATTTNPNAAKFLEYLTSAEGQAVFQQFGFVPMTKTP
ncbi:molybdate ABC transporter substrate-binding protein [Azospirillum griseum]|uniref:Molybdate ABC transporter substrate-binding protein n=2 Tax=Azospirillum griseum TaxID=2496639 RepID=A0A431VML2_9PROT|nr:molybdate ABC transporter substrate-binding protein [Azospirillum griseum]